MPNVTKERFLAEMTARFGRAERVNRSQSLFDVCDGNLRIYVRYSKKHERNRTFYGLRKIDLHLLEGRPSILCFLWNDQEEPLLVSFADFEEVFRTVEPADDGQYKVQVYEEQEATELYIANAGRFNVESYYGWTSAEILIEAGAAQVPELSHSQVQTLIGSLGAKKGYEIWVPANDRLKMDWSLATPFVRARTCPLSVIQIREVVEEIDVIWTERGSGVPKAFFEVEHSTPIYPALLRFNDVYIVSPRPGARFSIVSNHERRALFVRQLNRPTFRASGLTEACNFLEYRNVYMWHKRVVS